MRRFAIVMVSALALAACDSSPKVEATDASGAEVAKKVQESGVVDQFISPGQWQMAMKINEMTMPGMPPEAAEQMKGMMGQGQTFTQCLTPEEVKKPTADMFSGDENCKYDHFSMGGGKIDITMTCGGEQPRTMEMNGTYSADAYNMKITSKGQGESGPGAMSMNMEMAAKHIGECTAEQLKEANEG
ncbi:MAG: DUF3617 domain-containing protein [Sphingomonadaceae bacterium]